MVVAMKLVDYECVRNLPRFWAFYRVAYDRRKDSRTDRPADSQIDNWQCDEAKVINLSVWKCGKWT